MTNRAQSSQTFSYRFSRWFFEGTRRTKESAPHHQDAWWKVMCLTGVDYFSTLGYQPGIAFLAAGFLSPVATLIVVLITLFGLVPLYGRVAEESPHGQGSIAMLEKLLPQWGGKTLILILLGFAATSWVITITLSAADAAAHVVENPFISHWWSDRMGITMLMLTILGAVFLKGFREAIGISVMIVAVYLVVNGAVCARAFAELAAHPEKLGSWHQGLFQTHGSIWTMLGVSMLLFPKLALGMSGFETGVAVMPLVKTDPGDDPLKPAGRIRDTKKLLLCAALIMAVLLMCSSVITTVLIPPAEFQDGGQANGRALAYLAHLFYGEAFGTIYDISTILILWFAGASAMAGLLNLVPRYLPHYGMAPAWALAQRPLVVFFTLVNFIVTWIFKADVDAQAGAYATGVLMLFVSAGLAVFLSVRRRALHTQLRFLLILLIFVYTVIANIIKSPEGLQIASFFIGTTLITSLISRSFRSLELRVHEVRLDQKAEELVENMLRQTGQICLLAHRPYGSDYAIKEEETRRVHKLTEQEAQFLFLEVTLSDPSEFSEEIVEVKGELVDRFAILRCRSLAIPNVIAAILLHLRDKTGTMPYAYFGWTEGHPLGYVFRYIFLGEGETAPVTREILRTIEPDPERRPRVIVG